MRTENILPPTFEINESFKHLYAKRLLYHWLCQHESKTEGCNFCGFKWRRNQGIHMELPVYRSSNPNYFEHGSNSGKISFVPDITIFHKGQVFIIIEVVHKSAISNTKLKKIKRFFGSNHFELYEIQADHILNNTGIPTFLTYKLVA